MSEYMKMEDVWRIMQRHISGAGSETDVDEILQTLFEQVPKIRLTDCKDCAKRHNGCPLQVWCGPQDDDFCSRGVPKE